MAWTKAITCRDAVAFISRYLDDDLTWRERRRLEAHLAICEACSAYLDQMRTTIALTGQVGVEDLDDAALDRLLRLYEDYLGDEERP